jgi:hypothetical protein
MPDMNQTLYWSVVIATLFSSVYWLNTTVSLLRLRTKVPKLTRLQATLPSYWPRISVIIPACNEATTIEGALAAHLASTYPHIEFVVIDDRSTDASGEIMDRIAQTDARVKVVHITELPSGWLGKLNAMQVGVEQASGDWLLFTDADVHMTPDTLQRCIAWCLQEDVNYLTAIPKLITSSRLVDIVVSFFARSTFGGGQMWKSFDVKSRRCAGFGAFMLVNKKAWHQTQGLSWLRLEVADDVAIGQMIKGTQTKCAVVNATDALSLTIYPQLSDVKTSMEKGGFAIIGRYSVVRALAMSALLPMLEFGLFLGLLGPTWLLVLSSVVFLLGLGCCVFVERWLGRSAYVALFSPLGSVFFAYYVARSAIMGWRNGGIRWRGTFYSSEQLRSHMRVKWP